MQAGMFQGLFAGYKLLEIIGTGGSAMVYRAIETETDRTVALKILHSRIEEGTVDSRRFEREALIAQRLKHPGIIEIYGYGRFNGLAYFSMELMVGGSLGYRFRKPVTVALDETLKILEAIAEPLDYAHSQGVLHRDLKLDNIMIGANDELKLGDFGLSRIIETSRITTTGMTFGTPTYMSPEQIRNLRDIDSRSDIYSLGVIAYLLTTGYYPFSGGGDLTVMRQHLSEPPPLPSHLNPRLPRHMNNVLLKGLAKRPSDRYPTAAALVEAFRDSISRLTDVEIVVLTTQPTPVIHRQAAAAISPRGKKGEETIIFDLESDYSDTPVEAKLAGSARRIPIFSVVGVFVLIAIVGLMMYGYVQAMVPQAVPTPTEIGLEILATGSPTPTFTATPTEHTPTPTFTPSPMMTSSATPTPRVTESPTATPSRQSTLTRTPTRTTSTARPTRTPSRTTSPTWVGTGVGTQTAGTAAASTSVMIVTNTHLPVIIATTVRPSTSIPATVAQQTSVPATQVVPTRVPATQVPPTSIPPTAVPPTAVPPTAVPPTQVPPTPVPPTPVPPTPVPPTNTPVIVLPLPTIPLVQTLLPGLLG